MQPLLEVLRTDVWVCVCALCILYVIAYERTNDYGVSKCKNVEINDSQLNQVCCGVVVSCNLIAYFISFAIHYSVVSPVRRVFLRMNSGVGRILFLVLNLCTWNVVMVVLVISVHIYSSKTHKSLAKTMMLFRWKILWNEIFIIQQHKTMVLTFFEMLIRCLSHSR